jgi:hypothetical protein
MGPMYAINHPWETLILVSGILAIWWWHFGRDRD